MKMKRIALPFLFNVVIALNSTAADWKPVGITSQVTSVQPMTGLVLWPDEADDRFKTYGKSHALEFTYLAPCKVVKSCNNDGSIVYDWSYLDDLLDEVKSRNHQAVLRFFYEYPGLCTRRVGQSISQLLIHIHCETRTVERIRTHTTVSICATEMFLTEFDPFVNILILCIAPI